MLPILSQVDRPSTPPSGQPEARRSRRRFLRGSAALVGAGAALAVGPQAEAQTIGGVPALARHFRELQQHENDHVAFLVSALGSDSYPQPTFVGLQVRQYRQFAAISRVLENTGVGAYSGAAPLINNRQVLAQAASIATVEARHAGWLNSIFGAPLTQDNESFETALTPAQAAFGTLGFVADTAPVVAIVNAISTTPSDANDVAILRFALFLEYLEAAFYNVNVPRFFGGR